SYGAGTRRPAGLTAWTADGCTAERARIVKEFVPPDPAAPDARSWDDPDILARRLSTEVTDVRIERRSLPWHFDSGPALITFLRAHSPAYVIAAQAAGDRAGEMFAAIERTQRPTAAQCAKKRSTCWRWRASEWRWRS
ncbi:MAG: Methyltransferase family protein, partial [Pseudonocardiales bacterium]|nr:Methyltransferase family protein [Pseudonocardiales bacterium]